MGLQALLLMPGPALLKMLSSLTFAIDGIRLYFKLSFVVLFFVNIKVLTQSYF